MQRCAEDTLEDIVNPDNAMIRGMYEAGRYLEAHQNEHNIVVVLGSMIKADAFPLMLPNVIDSLSKVSASLVFIQSETGPAKYYSDFLLQAKHIIKKVGEGASENRKTFIVDNDMIKASNELKPFLGLGEGSMYDFPQNSMYKGGIFFPRHKEFIMPTLMEAIIDTLLDQIVIDNQHILNDLSEKLSISQSLYFFPNPLVDSILNDQGFEELPDSIFSPFIDKFHVEVRERFQIIEGGSNEYEPAFLLDPIEFKILINNLKRCVINPRFDAQGESQVSMNDRKYWSRESIYNFKELKKYFQYKEKINKVTLAQLIFMNTGIPVNNEFFRNLTLRNIKRRDRVKKEDLVPQIEYFHRDVFEMESYPSTHPESVVHRGNNVYYVIPASILP